ncbi:filamentous hemagglutinin N-terminal domain-containing protein, partial [Polynucleobacter paneuropaeus]|uniref:two-partner secretion domain-containing protein n=1 Tax=Polynucleobacter paneuropaeus TaxID=2527775 RepID=UPI0039EE20AB
MNSKRYRLIFSKVRSMLVAVAEYATGHDTGSTPRRKRTLVLAGAPSQETGIAMFAINVLKLSAALVLGGAYQVGTAQSLPTGGNVINGQAAITNPSSSKMLVTQSTDKAVINWQSFNVGAGNSVQFAQPSATSQVLNRVIGLSGSTQILGILTANGQVFIVNPQGVVFGNGAMVNVGALLASTKDISPSAFMAGGPLSLTGGSNGSGLISNSGCITANSGYIVLAGDQIRNSGTLNAPGGQIALAAGDQATLSLSNGQLVQLTLGASANNASISNDGIIQANNGTILLSTNATNTLLNSVINLSGVVSAQGGFVDIEGGPAGHVNVLNATIDASNKKDGFGGNITLSGQEISAYGATLLASGGGSGGTVILTGNSSVISSQLTLFDSAINVSATNPGSAAGTVVLSGDQVGLFGNTSIDASGLAAGGKVIIGGDKLGKVSDLIVVPPAKRTYIDGGVVINISSPQGNGGFVETSGQQLSMLGNVTGTSAGKNGQWLIDPTDITINTSSSTAINTSNIWAGLNNTSDVVNNQSISNALTSGVNVTVTTVSSGSAGGNLTLAADIINSGANNSTLTLFANRSLVMSNVNICATSSGALGLGASASNGTLSMAHVNISLNGGIANISGNNQSGVGVQITGDVNLDNAGAKPSSFNLNGTSNTS